MSIYLLYMAMPAGLYMLMGGRRERSEQENQRFNKYFLIFAGIMMAMMIGFRSPDNGSTDTRFYCDLWDRYTAMSFSYFRTFQPTLDMEIGFQYVSWFLSQIFEDHQWLLILSGTFMSISVCRFTYKNCENPVLALIVFNCLGLFGFMVQGLRQSVAMCICLWAVEFAKEKKAFKFFLLIGIACLFHASAVVFSIVYVMAYATLDLKSMLLLCGVAGFAVAYLPALFNLVNLVLNDTYEIGTGSEEGGMFAVLIHAAILLYGFAFADKNNKHYAMFICMTACALTCMVLRQMVSGILERVSEYFAYAQMVVISNGTNSMSEERDQVVFGIFIFCLCMVVAIYKTTYSDLIPYNFFWQ